MKKFIKGLMVFFGVCVFFIIVGVIVGAMADSGSEPAKKVADAVTTAAPAAEPQKDSTVNMENYNKIKVGDSMTGKGGMTIEEVTAVFGQDPSDKSETQTGDIKMVIATWMDDNFNTITVSFMNGRVDSKSQMGLDQ